MAKVMTFGEVVAYCRSEAPSCCENEAKLELQLRKGLVDMRVELGHVLPAKIAVPLTPVSGQSSYTIPSSLAGVRRVLVDGVPIPAMQTPTSVEAEAIESGGFRWSRRYETKPGNQIVFHPAPEVGSVVLLEGPPAFEEPLYTLDGQGTKLWRSIPLPVGLHEVYAEWVLALLIMDDDPGLGMSKLSLAQQSLRRMLRFLEQGDTTRIAPFTPNGARRLPSKRWADAEMDYGRFVVN